MSSWISLLLRIGEKCSEYGTSSDFKEHTLLLQCAEQLPHKIPLYGTLVGLLNSENEDSVKKMVETTQDNFQQVPEEIESVMVGIEAYLSIKRHNADTGLSFFEDDDESGSDVVQKDFLEDLWGRLQVLSGNGWKVDSGYATNSIASL